MQAMRMLWEIHQGDGSPIQRGKWVLSKGTEDELVPLSPQGAHSHAGTRASGYCGL